MKLEDIRLGMNVCVNQSSKYHNEWHGIAVTIFGMCYEDDLETVNITIRESDGMICDGWRIDELDDASLKPKYDEAELDELIEKGTKAWDGVSVDEIGEDE